MSYSDRCTTCTCERRDHAPREGRPGAGRCLVRGCTCTAFGGETSEGAVQEQNLAFGIPGNAGAFERSANFGAIALMREIEVVLDRFCYLEARYEILREAARFLPFVEKDGAPLVTRSRDWDAFEALVKENVRRAK